MENMSRKFFAVLLACLTVGLLAVPALALSDAEYKKMMKDPEFAAADKKLNEAWAKAQKGLPKAALEALKKDQRAWIAKGRDKDASEQGDTPRVEAYAFVTEVRAERLPRLAMQYELMAKPKGPEGYYARVGSGKEDGWFLIRWADKEKTSLALDAEVVLILSEDNVRTGAFEGKASLKGNRAEFADPDEEDSGSLIVEFNGDTLKATPKDGFDSYWGGLSVSFEGTYVRQKLK